MMILPTQDETKRRERRRVVNRTIELRNSASVDFPLSLGRDLVPFSPVASHRFI